MATSEEIGKQLTKVLSQHGHGFHYAVLRQAEELRHTGRSEWVLEAAEFPVVTGDTVLHIDFVLRHRRFPVYLVAECKRADPARARWCFVRAPYTTRDPDPDEILLEKVHVGESNDPISSIHTRHTGKGNYHLSVELKTNIRGDGMASRDAVGDAASQVLRGANGLINHFYAPLRASRGVPKTALFLPVIFSTAEVWASDVDLGASDLESGRAPDGSVTSRDWVWFTTNQSARLRHDLASGNESASLSDALRHDCARSMAVVSAGAVENFLASTLPDWLC